MTLEKGTSVPFFIILYFYQKHTYVESYSCYNCLWNICTMDCLENAYSSHFPLIILGLLFGPFSTVFLDKQWIDPENIFAGKTMYYFVSLSVGTILFEGGLTLKFKEVRQIAGVVRNLLILGSVIMLVGGAFAAHYFLNMDYRVGLLFGSLIIVTGPTVIAPILQSVRPNRNVSTVLKWEGIVIDPIGI